jgi:glycosyltransferase involved in cell wall biosynthesis
LADVAQSGDEERRAREVKTAFIVLTYNRPDTLLQVLRGLVSQCGEQHEVIIADDGSSQSSIEAVQKAVPLFKCPVIHVWHPDKGFTASRARNLAAGSSTADYFVFMDGDCVPNPNFVEAHSALLEPGFFVNGSRVLLSERLTAKILANEVDINNARWSDWLRWRLAGDANKFIHLLHWTNAPFRKESAFHWKKIRSCNFGVWRKDFLLVNGFDESFEGWGHEDADLVLRLHNAGLQRKNGFCATEVYHLWHKENSRNNELRNRHMVTQRLHTGVIRAVRGVDDALVTDDVRVTRFN